MMLDSGSAVSLVREDTLPEVQGIERLPPTKMRLVTASGEPMAVIDHIRISVQLGSEADHMTHCGGSHWTGMGRLLLTAGHVTTSFAECLIFVGVECVRMCCVSILDLSVCAYKLLICGRRVSSELCSEFVMLISIYCCDIAVQ